MCKLSPPFRDSFSSILFINGLINFFMFVLFLSMYVRDQQKNYIYAIIAFGFSFSSLILGSICKLEILINPKENNYEKI